MNRLKFHKSAIIVLVTILFFGYTVQESHVFYGGYEKMLYNGMAEVLNKEVIRLKGNISFHDPSYLENDTSAKLKLNIEGEFYFNRNEGHLDFFIVDAYGLNFLRIGSIYKESNHYYLMTDLSDTEPIILDEVINGMISSEDEQGEFWDKMYSDVIITHEYQSEQGKSGDINHKKNIEYTFDLRRVINQSFIEELSKQIGYSINFDELSLICHMDGTGRFESIVLKGDKLLSMEVMIIEPEKDTFQKMFKFF